MAKAIPFKAPPPSFHADEMRASPVGRTRYERRHLAALERRVAFLGEAVEDCDRRNPASGYARAELAALRWALSRIAEAERTEIVGDAAEAGDNP